MITLPYPKVFELVINRDRRRCVRCGAETAGVVGHGWDVIRRQEAGPRGTLMPHLDQPSNLITVCGSATYGCAGRIRRRDARPESTWWGYVIPRRGWPAAVPIVVDGQAVWLADDGTTSSTAPEPVEVEAAP